MAEHRNIRQAMEILSALGFPRAQQNERSALCLLAICDLSPDKTWAQATNPLAGITPMMDFARDRYGKTYKPNTRETFRRRSIHQFVDAGLALHNPDNPVRPTTSQDVVYQIAPEALALVRTFDTPEWGVALAAYLAEHETLVERYARAREQNMIPVQIRDKRCAFPLATITF